MEDALTSTTLRLYKWDEKDNSTYESASPPGKSYTLDSAFNRGRLAYVEDRQYGNATFYRYDALGRVISVVQHDGPLSSFSASSLVPIDFTYDNSGTQELVSITYPSGMVATYSYGNDKERPTGVSTSQGSFSLTNATYEPSGAVSGWYWQGSSSNARTITRDLLGRTAEILDKYSGSTWSDVKYYTTYVGDGYDGDGDLVKERDVSSSDTWLSHTTTGNKTRSYVYKDVRDSAELLGRRWDDRDNQLRGRRDEGERLTWVLQLRLDRLGARGGPHRRERVGVARLHLGRVHRRRRWAPSEHHVDRRNERNDDVRLRPRA